MKKQKLLLIVLLVLGVSVINLPASWADIKPEDKIKFRQSGYTFMRWNMGIIKKNVIKKPESYNKSQVLAAAKVIATISASGIETLFSANTHSGKGWKPTRAKPELFSNPETLKRHADKFKREANRLVDVSESGDVGLIKVQFNTLLDSCKACHKDFRTKI